LLGRCARQGDPGSCEAIVSLEDEIYVVYAPGMTRLLKRFIDAGAKVPNALHGVLRRLAQFRAERRSAEMRVQTLNLDRRLDRVLAFSGRGE
jgi:preprotein translocase subunit SecA